MESLRTKILMLNEAFNTYNSQPALPDSGYNFEKANQALYYGRSLTGLIKDANAYCDVLKRGEFDEMLNYRFWNTAKEFRWYKDTRLEHELLSLKDILLDEFNIAEETDGHCTKCASDLRRWIEDDIEELKNMMKDIKRLTANIPSEHFTAFYEKRSARIDIAPVEDFINEWKISIGKRTFKKVKAFQTSVVADFVNSGILGHAKDLPLGEVDEVDFEKVRSWLEPEYPYSKDFKKHCAIFRQFVRWKGHILILDTESYGEFVCMHMSEFTPKELMLIFQLEKKIMLINQEMMNLPLEERRLVMAEDEAEAQDSVDIRVTYALNQVKKERLIENLYDYTWIMGVMNDTDDMPDFDSPNSFRTYISGLGFADLPSESSIKKEFGKMLGKFPDWTFIGKDKTESDRRINVGKRFLNLYRNGVK